MGADVSSRVLFEGEDDVLSREDEEEEGGDAVIVVVRKTVEAGRGDSVVVTNTVDASTSFSILISEAGEALMVTRTSSLGMAVSVVISNPPMLPVFDTVSIGPEAIGLDASTVTNFVRVLRTRSTSTVETMTFS